MAASALELPLCVEIMWANFRIAGSFPFSIEVLNKIVNILDIGTFGIFRRTVGILSGQQEAPAGMLSIALLKSSQWKTIMSSSRGLEDFTVFIWSTEVI